jgi:hypothetical protein
MVNLANILGELRTGSDILNTLDNGYGVVVAPGSTRASGERVIRSNNDTRVVINERTQREANRDLGDPRFGYEGGTEDRNNNNISDVYERGNGRYISAAQAEAMLGDGRLTGDQVGRGLRNNARYFDEAGKPTDELLDMVRDMERVTGYRIIENGSIKVARLAEAIEQYKDMGGVSPEMYEALKRGNPQAWNDLDYGLDGRTGSPSQSYTPSVGQPAPVPAAPVAIPTQEYAADPVIAARLNEIFATTQMNEEQKREYLANLVASMQANGIEVKEGQNALEPLSGYIRATNPTLAATLTNNQGTTDLAADKEALNGFLDQFQVQAQQNLARANSGVAVAPSAPAIPQLTEAELLAAIERGDSLDDVSRIKEQLNRLYGTDFERNDDVRDPEFISTLTRALNENLDPNTIRDIKEGGAFVTAGTLDLVADNLERRANVERHRETFERAMDDGAMRQVISSVLNESGTEGHVELQQDLRALGYDSTSGLEGSLREYLSDKLYDQDNFRTAPREVQDFLRDVEAGKYNDSFPLTDPSNRRQMEAVRDYINDQISLDLAQQEQTTAQTTSVAQSTSVSNSFFAEAAERVRQRNISDIAMVMRDPYGVRTEEEKAAFAQEISSRYNITQAEIDAEIDRQNKANEARLAARGNAPATNNNPPADVAPTTPAPTTPAPAAEQPATPTASPAATNPSASYSAENLAEAQQTLDTVQNGQVGVTTTNLDISGTQPAPVQQDAATPPATANAPTAQDIQAQIQDLLSQAPAEVQPIVGMTLDGFANTLQQKGYAVNGRDDVVPVLSEYLANNPDAYARINAALSAQPVNQMEVISTINDVVNNIPAYSAPAPAVAPQQETQTTPAPPPANPFGVDLSTVALNGVTTGDNALFAPPPPVRNNETAIIASR